MCLLCRNVRFSMVAAVFAAEDIQFLHGLGVWTLTARSSGRGCSACRAWAPSILQSIAQPAAIISSAFAKTISFSVLRTVIRRLPRIRSAKAMTP